MEFRQLYRELLEVIVHNGIPQPNNRTGEDILVMPGGWHFMIPLTEVPIIDCRRTYLKTAAAEVGWFIRGEQSTKWLSKHTKIWEAFEEDIVASSSRKFIGQKIEYERGIKAAYGHRWRNHFGIDQLQEGILNLVRDPSSRQVWITAWDPKEDLPLEGQKNKPCPIGFNLYILGNCLFSSYFLRSSDVFVGLPYDVMNHALLMGVIATTLSKILDRPIRATGMTFSLGHAHMYSSHRPQAIECLKQPAPAAFQQVGIPDFMTLSEVEQDADKFVQYMAKASELKTDWPQFKVQPTLFV